MGTVLFDVITTDYETHAAITTCQNVFLFFKRQTTTFLSRTKHISETVLKEVQIFNSIFLSLFNHTKLVSDATQNV